MKLQLGLVAAFAVAMAVYGDGMTNVEIDGKAITNISRVYLSSSGKVIIVYPDGGTTADPDKLPADFLTSWKLDDKLTKYKSQKAVQDENNLDRAIQSGCFREVDGVVYDTRSAQSGFVLFRHVKMLQYLDGNAIIDTTPDDYANTVAIYVKNFPRVSDTDYVTFRALPAGTHSYINKNNDDRTINAFDMGEICSRSDIPPEVLSGAKPYADAKIDGKVQTDVLATLPEKDDLRASGSGFFISEDGYLITNNHVVKDARHVKVKNSDGVFPAEVLQTDSTNDLALLKVSGKFHSLSVSPADVQLGDAVFTIGFPDIVLQGTQPKYTDGKISSLSGLRDDPTEYQISVPVQPGNSGGPLVNTDGMVEGVIVARLDDLAALRSVGSLPQNVNYAVKGSVLRGFLGNCPGVKLPSDKTTSSKASAVSNVQQAVAIVLVY